MFLLAMLVFVSANVARQMQTRTGSLAARSPISAAAKTTNKNHRVSSRTVVDVGEGRKNGKSEEK